MCDPPKFKVLKGDKLNYKIRKDDSVKYQSNIGEVKT